MLKQCFFITCILFCLTVSVNSSVALNAEIVVILSCQNENVNITLNKFIAYLESNDVSCSITKFNLNEEKPEKILSELKNRKPDIVFSIGTNALDLANKNIRNTPVVFAYSYVTQNTQLNSNIYGVRLNTPVKKQLEIVKKIFPGIKNIGVFYSKNSIEFSNEISRTCKEMDLQFVGKEIDSDKEFTGSVTDIEKKIDCFMIIPDSSLFFMQSLKYLLLESLRQKFMVVGLSSYFTKAGAIMSLESDYEDLGKQTGEIAIKILKGEAQDVEKIHNARKLNTSINLLVAERLGIKIPSEIVKNAKKLFGRDSGD